MPVTSLVKPLVKGASNFVVDNLDQAVKLGRTTTKEIAQNANNGKWVQDLANETSDFLESQRTLTNLPPAQPKTKVDIF